MARDRWPVSSAWLCDGGRCRAMMSRLLSCAGRVIGAWWPAAGERCSRNGGRTMRHWLAHPASCAALVTDMRGLAPRTIFVVEAAARRCSDDVVTADFF
ncbi:hypothetical protein F511_47134 [Dorcoceras hygrometricum]|uniref:Uncharacterized protein n=1 Tax=Dorcoceras hygrometricum TaxID=472368 RepID=A0A2Z6ZSV5_9LAMI|nr:hypothetical protein F511_47134 [Dorcoceras hygrometricum]